MQSKRSRMSPNRSQHNHEIMHTLRESCTTKAYKEIKKHNTPPPPAAQQLHLQRSTSITLASNKNLRISEAKDKSARTPSHPNASIQYEQLLTNTSSCLQYTCLHSLHNSYNTRENHRTPRPSSPVLHLLQHESTNQEAQS